MILSGGIRLESPTETGLGHSCLLVRNFLEGKIVTRGVPVAGGMVEEVFRL